MYCQLNEVWMVRKKEKKIKSNLSSLFPVAPRGIGVEMGCGGSLPAPPGCSSLLPLLPVLAQALPWAPAGSLWLCLRGSSALGLQPLLPSSSSRSPIWGPSAAVPLLDARGTSAPLLSISVALTGVPGPFWASDCPCQPQHAAGCVPGPATT